MKFPWALLNWIPAFAGMTDFFVNPIQASQAAIPATSAAPSRQPHSLSFVIPAKAGIQK